MEKLIESHEERLQRLEEKTSEVYTGLGRLELLEKQLESQREEIQKLREASVAYGSALTELTVTMRSFSEQFKLNSQILCDKIQAVSTRLSERAEAVTQVVDGISKETKDQATRLKALEKSEDREIQLFDWKMKFWLGITTAGLAGLMNLVLEYFKKKFGG